MRFGTIITKFGAASVAGVLTIGGGLAFAEVGDGTTTDGSTEVVTTPTEGGTVTIPVEDGDVVIDGGTTDGTVTDGTTTDGTVTDGTTTDGTVTDGTTTDGTVTDGGEVVLDPVETVDPVDEEPVHVKPENHGKYVSEAAHTAPKGKGGVHGKAVSAVAKSEVGKKHAAPVVDGGDTGGDPAAATSASKAPKGGKGGKK
jgi:hypothetical protein